MGDNDDCDTESFNRPYWGAVALPLTGRGHRGRLSLLSSYHICRMNRTPPQLAGDIHIISIGRRVGVAPIHRQAWLQLLYNSCMHMTNRIHRSPGQVVGMSYPGTPTVGSIPPRLDPHSLDIPRGSFVPWAAAMANIAPRIYYRATHILSIWALHHVAKNKRRKFA